MRKLLLWFLAAFFFTGCQVTVVPETTLPQAETTLSILETTVPIAEVCIVCKDRPSDGYGPSGLECESCYYGNDTILEGTYQAEFENIQITLAHHDYVDYILTYRDLTSGTVLERIPLTYYNANSDTEISMMFLTEDSYPEHGGYVEICWTEGGIFLYSYNALIEGLTGTGGDYAPLEKIS